MLTAPKYEGYFADKDFHIQKGDKVLVKKGTKIKSTHPQYDEKIAGRNQVVTVHHILNGVSIPPSFEATNYGFSEQEVKDRIEAYHTAAMKDKTVDRMDFAFHVDNPSVVWPGTGGYWHEVDINEVEKVD